MLRIIVETPTVLVIKNQRNGGALLTAVFTVFSLLALEILVSQGVQVVIQPASGGAPIARVLSYAIFVLALSGCVGVGALTTLYLIVGTTCTFDKMAETLAIERMNLLRREREERPIYGFSHLDVETNAESRVYGVFVVLRSGERIPLAVVSYFDQAALEALLLRVRLFLRA